MKKDPYNIAILTVTESFWGFQSALVYTSTVLTILLRHYGAGDKLVGMISAIESGTIVLPQIIGIFIFRSMKKRKLHLILWHVVVMIPFLFLIGTLILYDDLFSHEMMRLLLLLLFACFNTAIGVTLAAWQDWIAHIFGKEIRGTAMGISFFFSSAAGFIAAFVAGKLINLHQGTEIYGILFIIAGIIANISILTAGLMREDTPHGKDDKADFNIGLIFAKFAESLKDSNFRAFILGRIMATAGFCILPFVAIYYMSEKGGGLSGGTIVSAGAAQTIGMALGNIFLGKIGDKHGHKTGIILGVVMQMCALLILAFSNGTASCYLAYFIIGLSISASIISHTNMIFETCPHDNRLAHITAGSLTMSVGSIGLPLLAGCFASVWGLQNLFLLSFALSSVALIWILAKLKEPRNIYVEIKRP